jgi:hypothetical protein
LLETQTQVAREREQREQQVMSTLEMMSLFKLHVQQVTEQRSARTCEPPLPTFSRRALMTWKSVLERFSKRSTSKTSFADHAAAVVETAPQKASQDNDLCA